MARARIWMSGHATALILYACGSGAARADDATLAEIALLKAQLHRLEAKVDSRIGANGTVQGPSGKPPQPTL